MQNVEILEQLLEILNNNIEEKIISIDNLDEELSALGMNSIVFIQIIVAIEEKFNIEVPDDKLLLTEMGTVNKMLDVITSSN